MGKYRDKELFRSFIGGVVYIWTNVDSKERYILCKGDCIMNKILLINRIDPQDYSNTKNKVFIMIGGMNIPAVDNRLIDVINDSNIVEPDDMVLKYNGIELNITIQQIPAIVKLLCDESFSIYGIYQLYNPDE